LEIRAEARAMLRAGFSQADVARRLGVSRAAVRSWCSATLPTDYVTRTCVRCQVPAELPVRAADYAYLLGQYLGDGHLATDVRVPMLRIACAAAYPVIMDEVEAAMRSVLARSVSRVAQAGCFHVKSYSKHWPCLLPQHGPGPKHLRPIVLEPWQKAIVATEPKALLRGLIHSDGCRVLNRVTAKGREYAYPRYHFSNESTDILQICADALDRVDVRWRFNRANSISVARRDSVATLDAFIGPKG
jgi:hypothetical protein